MIGRDKSIFIGSTPILSFEDSLKSKRRGNEIKTWLDNNTEPGTVRYCVVDDETCDIVGVIPNKRIVKTDMNVGLTEDNANKIIHILNS